MAEGSCSFCGVWSRNACDDRRDASTCPNNSNRGSYHNFKAAEVAEWIKANSNGNRELDAAAELIEREL